MLVHPRGIRRSVCHNLSSPLAVYESAAVTHANQAAFL